MHTSQDTTIVRRSLFALGHDVLLFASIGLVAAATTGMWITGQLASLLASGTWLHAGIGDAFAALLRLPVHLADPQAAWPERVRGPLPGPIGLYACMLAAFSSISIVAAYATRSVTARRRPRGFASRRQLDAALSKKAALARASRLRPGLAALGARIGDVAVSLGTAILQGGQLWASIENSVVLFAAPRQGKTSQVLIPWLASWPGPAIATSVRSDVIDNTLELREQLGPVAVMDLSGQTWPQRLRWSPVDGCESFDVARKRADVMVTVGKNGDDSENAGYFGLTATNLLAGWMHAAALTGRDMSDVLRWALDEHDAEAIRLLSDNPDAAEGVSGMLDAIYRSPIDTRSNMWTTTLTSVAPLLSETARETFCPPAGDSFDIDAFLAESGTVYLQVPESDAVGLAPLVAAFVDEIIETATRTANRSTSGRLDPPLGFFGDEIANVVPLPRLPSLMSYAGGSGIFVLTVLQNLAQARQRWGRDGADMLWGAATCKIALGGLSGDELEEFSKLAGTYRETLLTTQHGPHGNHLSANLTDRKTLAAHDVRQLDEADRQALIIHATTPAVTARMIRHYESGRATTYAASVAHVQRLRQQGGRS